MARIKYVPNRVIDHNGISDGANVFVYQSGTTTPVQLYLDEALTEPVSNPYPVPTGAPVPVLYHDFAGHVRMRVVAADGSVPLDEDPYDISVLASDLASSTGAEGVGYKFADPDAILRALSDKLSEFRSVLDYGAVRDGATDSLSAIELAIAAAVTAEQRLLTIPPGDYYLSDTLVVTANDLTIIANGARFFSDSTEGCVRLGSPGARIQRTHFLGGQFLRVGGAVNYSGGFGIRIENGNWCSIRPENVLGWKSGVSLYASAGQGTSYCDVQLSRVSDCLRPIEVLASGSSAFVNDNNVHSGRAGYSTGSPSAAGGYNIYIDAENGGAAPNMNRFWGVALEGSPTAGLAEAPIYNNGVRNYFFALRFEANWTSPYMAVEGPDAIALNGRSFYFGGRGFSGASELFPANSRSMVFGEDGVYLGGGSSNDALLTLQQLSSNLNKAIDVRDVLGQTSFSVNSFGDVFLGQNQQCAVRKAWFQETALSFGTVVAGSSVERTITVTGTSNARTAVTATPQGNPGSGLAFTVYTAGANTIRIRASNPSAADIVSIDRTWTIEVREYAPAS